jgi:hypothetical protein
LVVAMLGASGCLAAWSPCKPDDGSLLSGGDFDSLGCWEDRQRNWDGDVSVDELAGSPSGGAALRVDNRFPGDEPTDITVSQRGGNTLMRDTLFVEGGVDLTIRLWAQADADDRAFAVNLYDVEAPGRSLVTFDGTATRSWAESTFTFRPTSDMDLLFELGVGGADPATLWIDDARLVVAGDD